MLRRGCNPYGGVWDWQNMQAYSHRDIFCALHSTSMALLPEDPTLNWERLEGSRCNIPITKDAIIETFRAVEQIIEKELNVAIQFYNGVLLVESAEYIGSKRRLKKRKLLNPYEVQTVKDMFTHLIKKQLGVAIEDVVDLWQR